MKAGKLAEAVERRSVTKLIRAKGKEPAGVVASCEGAAGTENFIMAVGELVVEYLCQIAFLANRVAGLLAAEAAKAVTAVFALALPIESEEAELKQLVRACQAAAEKLGIESYTVHPRSSSTVTKPVLSVTMTGVQAEGLCSEVQAQEKIPFGAGSSEPKATDAAKAVETTPQVRNDCAILMAGYAAMEATVCMMEAAQEKLAARLSKQFLQDGKELLVQTDTRQAIAIALEQGALVKTAGEGGIFTALWELGSYLDCGMQVELRELLLRQETIEVCEILDLNPYLMLSGGAILAVTNRPEELLTAYKAAGIPAAKVGVLTGGHDRILNNGEEQRYLEPFREDELYRTGILH